ncbi:MAG: chromosomal replication initiator protein DnaA [Cytophagales bacterium]|nr:MAG: chromosomal replication initiator protein DnaA [Cytophagales bacterium]
MTYNTGTIEGNTLSKDFYTIWENCLQMIRQEINDEQAYQTWFEPIKPVRLQDLALTIQVPNQFFYEWLEEHYVSLLKKVLDQVLGKGATLLYAVNHESQNNGQGTHANGAQQPNGQNSAANKAMIINNNQNFQKQQSLYEDDFRLITHYTFENFIEGSCNKLARAAGIAIAERPGVSSFNPLLLYGGVGLGKTHLLQAIGNHIKNLQSDHKVVYVSSDKFTNQFVDALRRQDVPSFTQFYMQVDVLLIDDVQFLSGKERIQEMFFHVFNHLHQLGKQVVMTSDRPPRDLKGIEDRLISRFKWGLTADLQQPDVETRMAIIKQKIERNESEVPEDVVEYLANTIDSNIRELEGAVGSLLMQSRLLNQGNITIDMAKNIVQQIVQTENNREITVEDIQNEVAAYLGITVEDMKSKNRKKETVIARQIAMYLTKELTEFSLKSIGYHFGNRDHSTVIHAITCINDYIQDRKEIKMCVDDLMHKLQKQ